jgi:hypothetical protein
LAFAKHIFFGRGAKLDIFFNHFSMHPDIFQKIFCWAQRIQTSFSTSLDRPDSTTVRFLPQAAQMRKKVLLTISKMADFGHLM